MKKKYKISIRIFFLIVLAVGSYEIFSILKTPQIVVSVTVIEDSTGVKNDTLISDKRSHLVASYVVNPDLYQRIKRGDTLYLISNSKGFSLIEINAEKYHWLIKAGYNLTISRLEIIKKI